MNTQYFLPTLPYDYKALSPFISEEQLKIHHQKHHQAYVDGANKLAENLTVDNLKKFSFNIGGHILHSLFWECLAPKKEGGEISDKLGEMIKNDFSNAEYFKDEFIKTALTVEGSGWAALVYDDLLHKLRLMQIEKHNANIFPNFKILMVIDVFEHAYYLDYKNDRAKYLEAIWQIINWQKIGNNVKITESNNK